MRAGLGIGSVLVALLIVLLLTVRGLRQPHDAASAAPATASAAASASTNALLATPQQVQQDVNAALREGAARNEAAERDLK